MKLIVISNPGYVEGEHELINSLLSSGVDYFHLRKPEFSKADMEAFIRSLNPLFMKKVMLHSQHGLVTHYNIGGFHFPSSYLEKENKNLLNTLVNEARKRKLRTGTSVHNIQEANDLKGFDYYFLSPVFDSISKEGYKASFDLSVLEKMLYNKNNLKHQPEAFALGGVDEHNVSELRKIGFSGVALLGAIWKDYKSEKLETTLQKLKRIQMQLVYES